MEITMLCDDVCFNSDLGKEHGLSMYIKTAKQNILFDFGATNLFIKNAKALNIDLHNVDVAFLSHGHYDHGGGINSFLEINDKADIYVSKNAFGSYYSLKKGFYKYIGIDKNLENSKRIKKVFTNKKINDILTVFDSVEHYFPNATANKAMYKPINTKYINENFIDNGENKKRFVNDDFCHEQHLIINENNKSILIVGCSHKGIVNILESYKTKYNKYPDIVIGGFHLQNPTTKVSEKPEYIEKIATYLEKTNSSFYTCHCTGIDVYELLKTKLKNKIFYFACGNSIEL